MERWAGKVAIVTGASAGIGEAIVIKLVEAGMKVAGFARRSEKVEALSKSLKDKKGRLYAVKCDVTQDEDIFKCFKWVQDNLGLVHVLVNNAGVAKQTRLIDGNISLWRDVINTNLLGLCICTREAIRQMRSLGKDKEIAGHIIHINSIVGHQISSLIPDSNVYPATKFGITALAETLRIELNNLASRIKITSISPGLVKTEIATANNFVFNEDIVKLMQNVPILDSEDVADSVIYALSTKPHVLVQELIIRPVGEKL